MSLFCLWYLGEFWGRVSWALPAVDITPNSVPKEPDLSKKGLQQYWGSDCWLQQYSSSTWHSRRKLVAQFDSGSSRMQNWWSSLDEPKKWTCHWTQRNTRRFWNWWIHFRRGREFHGNGDHCKTFRFLEQKSYPESHSLFTLSLGILSIPNPSFNGIAK